MMNKLFNSMKVKQRNFYFGRTNTDGAAILRTITFANGYGASVINDGYGCREKPFELAVTLRGRLCYDTPITDDVLGWLTEDEVEEYLNQIKDLEAA